MGGGVGGKVMRCRNILNGRGQLRARLDEGDNTQLFVYDRNGRALGVYNQVQDKTYSMSGQYVGPGDQRMVLVRDE